MGPLLTSGRRAGGKDSAEGQALSPFASPTVSLCSSPGLLLLRGPVVRLRGIVFARRRQVRARRARGRVGHHGWFRWARQSSRGGMRIREGEDDGWFAVGSPWHERRKVKVVRGGGGGGRAERRLTVRGVRGGPGAMSSDGCSFVPRFAPPNVQKKGRRRGALAASPPPNGQPRRQLTSSRPAPAVVVHSEFACSPVLPCRPPEPPQTPARARLGALSLPSHTPPLHARARASTHQAINQSINPPPSLKER